LVLSAGKVYLVSSRKHVVLERLVRKC